MCSGIGACMFVGGYAIVWVSLVVCGIIAAVHVIRNPDRRSCS